jgi:hypothetical protein
MNTYKLFYMRPDAGHLRQVGDHRQGDPARSEAFVWIKIVDLARRKVRPCP